MKSKLFLLAVCSLGAQLALADIPHPPRPEPAPIVVMPPQQIEVQGRDAFDLGNSLKGDEIPGSQSFRGYTVYKVFRSSNGTTQIECELQRGANTRINMRLNKCTILQSQDGRSLPEFVAPQRRMG